MSILNRYIGMQILTSALFATCVLSVVLVLGNIFKRLLDLLVNHDVPLDFILKFMAYILPYSLTFTIPWGFLTAVLLIFGRLSAENELTAMRANGVSLFQISVPVIVLAVVFSGTCLYINVVVAPKAQDRMRSTMFEIATSNPLALFGSDTVIENFPGRRIYIGEKDGATLRDVFIFEMNDSYVPVRVTHASRAVLETDSLEADLPPHEKFINMRLFDARYEERDPADALDILAIRHGITMAEGVISISLEELYESNMRGRSLGQMTIEELGNVGDNIETEVEQVSSARVEIHKRFSFSLACLAFGLIAMPLGITAQRRETSIGFALSIIIAFTYFLFIIIAETMRGNPEARPELLIWLPNVVFISLGAFLMLRMFRK